MNTGFSHRIITSLKCRTYVCPYKKQLLYIFSLPAGRMFSNIVVNHQLGIDPTCKQNLDEGMKHRRHSGILRVKQVELPTKLKEATSILVEKFPIDDLKNKSFELRKYLWSRNLSTEQEVLQSAARKLEKELISQETVDVEMLNHQEKRDLEKRIKSKVIRLLRRHFYHWEPIKFDAHRSLLYLIGRTAFDYSSVYRIFSEISVRLPGFKPNSVFHFGSGTGSTIWASDAIWKKSIVDHYCVDVSDEMNTLARLLLQGGMEEAPMCISGVYFRQYFPQSNSRMYDLVVSAFSLIELPSREDRIKMIDALWMKTDQFLVIVENGTKAGFDIVTEARDYILRLKSERNSDLHPDEGHIFSPCPHDNKCPRVELNDGTPCNFDVNFQELEQSISNDKSHTARISYVVLKKGPRDTSVVPWPRIVRKSGTPSGCVHLHTCSPEGELQYSAITKGKHGRDLYRCAKACRWGDLLPAVPGQVISWRKLKELNNSNVSKESTDSNVSIDSNISNDSNDSEKNTDSKITEHDTIDDKK